MRQDGLEFRSVQAAERPGGDHDAVRGRAGSTPGPVVFENHHARDRAGPPDQGQHLVVPEPGCAWPAAIADAAAQTRRPIAVSDAAQPCSLSHPARRGVVVAPAGRGIQIRPVRQAGNGDEQAGQQH